MRVLLFACFKISVIVKKCICQSSCSNCVFVFSYWPTAVCCFISPDLYKSRPFFPSIFCVDRFNIWLPFTSNKANVCPFLAITWTKWMSPDVIFYQPFLTLRTLLCCLFVFFYRIYVLPFCTSHQMFFFFISLLCRRCGRCSWAPGLLWLTCSWPCPLSTLSWSSTMISTSHRLLSRNL